MPIAGIIRKWRTVAAGFAVRQERYFGRTIAPSHRLDQRSAEACGQTFGVNLSENVISRKLGDRPDLMEIPVPVCSGGTDMKKDEGFSVEVESRYEGWWRYNVTILCGCFDADGNRIGFASAESVVAPVGSDLSAPPEGAAAERRIGIRSIACDHIVMYVYIARIQAKNSKNPPNRTPVIHAMQPFETREIGDVAPFDVRLRVGYGGVPFGDMHYRINQWSGASLEIKLRNDGKPFRA